MNQAIKDFKSEVFNPYFTSRNTATQFKCRHSRTGKLPSFCTASQKREASTYTLLAFGWDELGNVLALTTKGARQFI